MQIMTQDRKRLVNGDFVHSIYIESTSDGIELVAVCADEEILLGTYDETAHAEEALTFIGASMVNEATQSKITQVPTRDDMTRNDSFLASIFKKR